MSTPQHNPAKAPGRDTRRGQRFGQVIGRHPSTSPGSYLVRDDHTGRPYSFSYTDIVTEGFRAIRTGERVRFLIDPAHPGHASYVIRLDQPDIGEYYT
jgi:hypothetical protein